MRLAAFRVYPSGDRDQAFSDAIGERYPESPERGPSSEDSVRSRCCSATASALSGFTKLLQTSIRARGGGTDLTLHCAYGHLLARWSSTLTFNDAR